MKKFLNLVFLFAILILMVNQISAGQYCELKIENATPIDFNNRTKFDSYQMVTWYCPESIPKNSTTYCHMNPSSNIFIDRTKTGSNAFYLSPNQESGFLIRTYADINRGFHIRAVVVSEDYDIYEEETLTYPDYTIGRTCLFTLRFSLNNPDTWRHKTEFNFQSHIGGPF